MCAHMRNGYACVRARANLLIIAAYGPISRVHKTRIEMIALCRRKNGNHNRLSAVRYVWHTILSAVVSDTDPLIEPLCVTISQFFTFIISKFRS